MLPVVEDSHLIGRISAKQIATIPREQWTQLRARDVTTPCSQENTIDINTGVLRALSIMHRTGNSRLLIMDGDHLVGIVTLKDLMKLLAQTLDLERVE